MKARILNNGKIVNKVDIKVSGHENGFDAIRKLAAMQQADDVFKLGRTGNLDLGIKSISHKNGIISSSEDKLGLRKCLFDGTELEYVFTIEMYETGFVLNLGYTGSNLLGQCFDAYLTYYGKRQIRSGPKDSAKVFPTLKSLKAFLEKNINSLHYVTEKYGWQWGYEDANNLSAEDYSELSSKMTPKRKEKEEILKKDIEELLAEINTVDVDDDDRMPAEMPTEITPEVMKDEALRRMELLSMWENVVNDFKDDGKIYMSEFAGIIYDLNDDAKKAVREVTDEGYLAYAVIRQMTNIGELYSVLYVSNKADEWEYEIPDRNGALTGCVYNKTSDDFEWGSIQVKSSNGGLTRVA